MKIFKSIFKKIGSSKRVFNYIWTHPSNRNKKFYALIKAVSWQIYKRLQPGPHDIKIFGGLTLRCYPDSPSASLMIYCDENPDYHEMHFLRCYLLDGDRMLDVGANIGVYSLLGASLVGHSGHIIAFEPGPEANRRLKENIAINGLKNVSIYSCALGDKNREINFLDMCDTTNRIQTADDVGQSVISVPLVRLEEIIDGTFAIGKMDIEGAEPDALRGAQEMLKRSNPPVWLLELNGSLHAFGYTESSFAKWLSEQGYDLALYDADRNEINFTNSMPWLVSPNVFAIARNRKHEVAERCGARLIEI